MHRDTSSTRSSLLALALSSATACGPSTSVASAQTVGGTAVAMSPADVRAHFAGTFVWAGGAPERTRINAEIERVISQLGFIAAPFARGPLHDHNPIYPEISLQFTGGQIVIVYNHHTWAAPENGTAVAHRTDFNDAAHLSHWISGDHVVQLINAADGGRRNEFYLSPDGTTLTVRATMFSPRLPSQIRYAMTYRRR